MVPVVFRRIRKTGAIMAVLPTIPVTADGQKALGITKGNCESVDVSSVLAESEPATPKEYSGPLIYLIRSGFSSLYVAQQVQWWMILRRREVLDSIN